MTDEYLTKDEFYKFAGEMRERVARLETRMTNEVSHELSKVRSRSLWISLTAVLVNAFIAVLQILVR